MLFGCLGYAFAPARRPELWGATLGAAASLLSLATYAFLGVVPEYNCRFAFPLLVSCVPPLAVLAGVLLSRTVKASPPL
jgi:hypothetical protein